MTVSHGDGHTHELPYDHLVLAPGSVTNFFSLPGLEERAITMKSLGDAIALRNRMIAAARGSRDRVRRSGPATTS